MAQTAQQIILDDKKDVVPIILDRKKDVIEVISDTTTTNFNMGVFKPVEIIKKTGPGPMFTQNITPDQPKISDIKSPINVNNKLLESFDIRRLGSILAQEAVKLGNLDPERVTELDRNKILEALYAINPKKYPLMFSDEGKYQPQDITFPAASNEPVILENEIIPTGNTSKVFRPNSGKTNLRLIKNESAIPEVTPTQPEIVEQEHAVDLFDSLHTSPKEEVASIIAEPIKEIVEEVIINPEQKISQEKEKKMTKVGNLFDIMNKRFTTIEEWAGPTATSVKSNNPNQPSSQPEKISWVNNLENEESKSFVRDISSLSEELLISKYVPSYANTGNPSSWSSVSEFDAYEILHNPNVIYGLTDEKRLEVSKLIISMMKIIRLTNNGEDISPNTTVHSMYEQTRRTIASLDKTDNN